MSFRWILWWERLRFWCNQANQPCSWYFHNKTAWISILGAYDKYSDENSRLQKFWVNKYLLKDCKSKYVNNERRLFSLIFICWLHVWSICRKIQLNWKYFCEWPWSLHYWAFLLCTRNFTRFAEAGDCSFFRLQPAMRIVWLIIFTVL